MGLKERVMELLRTADAAGLEQLARADARAARHLFGRLWDGDSEIRRCAACGLGAAASAHPELGRDLLRRLLWALNDESATNGGYGLAAIGEIGRRAPELVAPFVGPVAAAAADRGLRLEVVRALRRIAEAAPELVAPHVADTLRWVDDFDDDERPVAAELRRLIQEVR